MKPKWALIIAVRHTARKVGPAAPRLRTTFQAAGLVAGARIEIEATAMA
jgi:enamine deaminase RidA (YjgF/YER057c/UK114 family)